MGKSYKELQKELSEISDLLLEEFQDKMKDVSKEDFDAFDKQSEELLKSLKKLKNE